MSGGFSFASPAKDSGGVSRKSDAEAQPPLADDMRTLQPGAEYWLNHTPDLGKMKADQLLDEMRQIDQWEARQLASTPDVLRMDAVKAQMQAGADALGRKAYAKAKPAKKPASKARGRNKAPEAAADKGAAPPAPLPRLLREHQSIQTSDPKVLTAEYDEIVEALQRDDLTQGDRKILQAELANLGPAMGQELENRAAKRQAETVTAALTHPGQGGGSVDTVAIARRIDSVRPLSGHPGQNYLMDGNEMVVIPDAQLKSIKASVIRSLSQQAEDIHERNEDVQADLHEFVDRTYDEHPYVGALSMVGSGENPLDWDEKIMPLVRGSNMARNRFAEMKKKAADPWSGETVSMEAMATAISQADVIADGARYAFDSRQDKMFAATAAQVKVLQVAKVGGQLASNIAFTPAGAALYAAVEDSAVQGLEIHYGQRDHFDYASVLIDAGAAYVGGKVNAGIMGMAGKEANAARKAVFFVASDRAGAAATTATSMLAHDAASALDIGAKSDQRTFSAGDILGATGDQLTDVKGIAEDALMGKLGHAAKGGGGGGRGPRIPRGSGLGRGSNGGSQPAAAPERVVAPETPATPRAEAGTTAEAARHPQAGPKLPAIEWKPIPPAQGAAPVTETPAAAAPASLDPMLAEWGKNPVEQDRAMSRKAYQDMKREQRISKRISKSLVPGGEFDANFAQLESGSPASGMGAERFVQIGETYHNENAVESQKDASAERQAQLRAQRDPVVQGRIDRANSRPAVPVQDSGTSGSKRKPSPPVGVSTSRIEAAVDRARKALKQQGVSGLHPSQYGDRLHTELRQTAESRLGKRLNPGTEFFNDRPMREIMGMSDAEAALPVADWLKHRGLEVPHLSTELRETPVGSLRPDLVYREPGNAYQMVDLTSQPNSPHLAKSLLYGLVLGNQ